jgi:hypothetical protein
MNKRKPIIYIAGSCQSERTKRLKILLKDTSSDLVKYIDPADFGPSRDKYEEVSNVNDSAINLCDLMICILFNQTAGASIELFINCKMLNKPALIVTNISKQELTPRIRSLSDKVYDMANIKKALSEWIEDWYK